jgi:hypothetical protein
MLRSGRPAWVARLARRKQIDDFCQRRHCCIMRLYMSRSFVLRPYLIATPAEKGFKDERDRGKLNLSNSTIKAMVAAAVGATSPLGGLDWLCSRDLT